MSEQKVVKTALRTRATEELGREVEDELDKQPKSHDEQVIAFQQILKDSHCDGERQG